MDKALAIWIGTEIILLLLLLILLFKKGRDSKKEPKENLIVISDYDNSNLTKKEQAKRDEMRKATQRKMAEQSGGGRITNEDLKQIKLTEIWGIGPKTAQYYISHGVEDVVALSKLANYKINQKDFFSNLPTINSYSPEMKKAKIISNKNEAIHMITLLKETNSI